MTFVSRQRLLVSACVLPMALTVPAYAQTAGQDQELRQTEVVVFAQKREQSLQDVPVSVTALDQAILEAAGVRDIKDLTILTPGLLVTSTSNETVTTARIRGIGTVGDNPGLESSVGVIIDGVYRPRNGVGFGDLGEIERIEVLKGPQGTLFGKNTSAGVIQVFSAAPEFEFSSRAEATIGNFEKVGLSGSVTGPIIADKLAFRAYATVQQRDGFTDVNTGPNSLASGRRFRDESTDGDQNYYSLRGQLLFTPNDTTDIRLIADFSARDENCCVGVVLPSPNPNAAGQSPTQNLINFLAGGEATRRPAQPFGRLAHSNRGTEQEIEDSGIQATVDIDLGWADFNSTTAVRYWETVNGQDADFTALDIWYRPADGNNARTFDTFSQEFRLNGATDFGGMDLNWLIGGFFAQEDLLTEDALLYGLDYYAYFAGRPTNPTGTRGLLNAAPASFGLVEGTIFQQGTGVRDTHKQEAETLAIFTNNSLAVTDKLELTLGLRYTVDDKELQSTFNTTGGGCQAALAGQAGIIGALGAASAGAILGNLCLPWMNNQFNGNLAQSLEQREWTYTAKAAYRWTDDFMTYGSFARGYKAGGFNHDREQNFGFNGTAFAVTRDNDTSFQGEFVDSFELGAKSTLLGGSLRLNGAAFLQNYENFQLNTFLGTNFIVTPIPEVESSGIEADFLWLPPVDGLTLQGGFTYSKTEYGTFTPVASGIALLPGATVSFAPEWATSGSISYERPIGNFVFSSSLNARYTSEYSTASDLLPAKDQDAFTLVNGRVGLGTADGKWTVELWAQNLTDEDYLQVGFNGPLQGSSGVATPTSTYNPAADTLTYMGFLGAPRTWGLTLKAAF
jgi:outer membrane receptor protein involved in Fe transport